MLLQIEQTIYVVGIYSMAGVKKLYYSDIPYSLKFSRIKYFAVLPNSAQKQFFVDKKFVV